MNPASMLICMRNQKAAVSVGRWWGNGTSCMMAIQPNSPISKALRARKSALAARLRPSPTDRWRMGLDDVVLEQDSPAEREDAVEGAPHREREPGQLQAGGEHGPFGDQVAQDAACAAVGGADRGPAQNGLD